MFAQWHPQPRGLEGLGFLPQQQQQQQNDPDLSLLLLAAKIPPAPIIAIVDVGLRPNIHGFDAAGWFAFFVVAFSGSDDPSSEQALTDERLVLSGAIDTPAGVISEPLTFAFVVRIAQPRLRVPLMTPSPKSTTAMVFGDRSSLPNSPSSNVALTPPGV